MKTITKETIRQYGSLSGRDDSFDDNTEMGVFRKFLQRTRSDLVVVPKPYGPYGVDIAYKDEDGDYVTCSDCGGSGEEEDDCSHCGGSGYHEYLEDIEKIDSFTVMVFSKEPIIIDELVDKHISTVSKLGMVKGKYKFMDTKAEPKNMGGVYEEEEMIDYVYDSHIVVRGEDLTDYV